MSKYSVSERISIVKAYYSSNNSPIAAQRKFATEYYKLKTTSPSVITSKISLKIFRELVVSMSRHFSDFLQNFALRPSHVIPIDAKLNVMSQTMPKYL
ncbi:hypothetical protein AVEN_254888-1 [Araneus ventricosus]|uniref:DUF4817 domain-containing protein n=1 Tax=Araneus ventricosus TaxID=182803 RepID=A0A4Y2N3A7_ARAVE|nr:hypothetical protein AVEN_254888-1 [Araneus ventricosus]